MSRPDKLAVHVFEVDEDVDKDEVSESGWNTASCLHSKDNIKWNESRCLYLFYSVQFVKRASQKQAKAHTDTASSSHTNLLPLFASTDDLFRELQLYQQQLLYRYLRTLV